MVGGGGPRGVRGYGSEGRGRRIGGKRREKEGKGGMERRRGTQKKKKKFS